MPSKFGFRTIEDEIQNVQPQIDRLKPIADILELTAFEILGDYNQARGEEFSRQGGVAQLALPHQLIAVWRWETAHLVIELLERTPHRPYSWQIPEKTRYEYGIYMWERDVLVLYQEGFFGALSALQEVLREAGMNVCPACSFKVYDAVPGATMEDSVQFVFMLPVNSAELPAAPADEHS